MSIPVVDFGAYSLSEEDVTDEQMRHLSQELKAAFTEVGFVFLRNTGITREEVRRARSKVARGILLCGKCLKCHASFLPWCFEKVDRVMDASKKFFLQPDELKQPFSRKSFANNANHGWVSLETERWEDSTQHTKDLQNSLFFFSVNF